MYIFIDTNLYQQPIRSRSPESKDFEDLQAYLKKNIGRQVLILTDQVYDEYYRVEEKCIASARQQVLIEKSPIDDVRALLLKKPQENLTKEGREMLKSATKIVESFDDGRERRLQQFDEKSEQAKKTIAKLFSNARTLSCTDEVFRNAEIRTRRGMHPHTNKGGDQDSDESSVGDAINWELLLAHHDDGDYVFISKDGDFVDDSGKLHRTLSDEWKRRHPKAKIKIFRSVHEFLDSVGAVRKQKKLKKKKSKEAAKVAPPPVTTGVQIGTDVTNSLTDPDYASRVLYSDAIVAPQHFTIGNGHTELSSSDLFINGSFYAHGEGPKQCPFCTAGPDKLTAGWSMSSKKTYFCTNCGRTFDA